MLSVVDQVFLSGLNFGVGMALIRFSTTSNYGLYSQLFAAGLLAVGLQDALIGSPLTTLAPGMGAHERALTIRRSIHAQWGCALVVALLMGLGAAWFSRDIDLGVTPCLLGLAYGVFILAVSLREFRRSLWFIHGDMPSLLRSDLAFVGLAVAMGGGLLIWHELTAASVLGVLALAHGLALGVGRGEPSVAAGADSPSWRTTYGRIWEKGRWVVPGALVGWASNYSFLYLASAMAGVEAAAQVSASRLLLVPVGLMLQAWTRVARPVAGRLLHARDWPALSRLTWRSWCGIELLSAVYFSILMLALPWLQHHVLGAKYQGITALIWAWGGFFLVNVSRSISTTWLTSIGAFRPLFIEGCVVVVFMVAVSSWLIPRWGALGAVYALILMEVFDTLLLSGMIRWQRRRLDAGDSLHA